MSEDDHVLRIVTSLVAGASMMPGFTVELAALMSLQAAERAAALADGDPFLRALLAEFAEHRDEVMHDPAAFRAWIEDLERRVVAESLRRNRASAELNAGRTAG
jgi:hypothetical protein